MAYNTIEPPNQIGASGNRIVTTTFIMLNSTGPRLEDLPETTYCVTPGSRGSLMGVLVYSNWVTMVYWKG